MRSILSQSAVTLLLVCSSFSAIAEKIDLTTADSLPFVNTSAKQKWDEYVAAKGNKAYAISETGAWASRKDQSSEDEARQKALAACEKYGSPCALFALNDEKVWTTEYNVASILKSAKRILKNAKLESEYGKEKETSMFVGPTDKIKSDDKFHSMTPPTIPGGKTLSTSELRDLIVAEKPLVLIDVLPADTERTTIFGAEILANAGFGEHETSKERVLKFEEVVLETIGGNKETAVVFFCQGFECWYSYNAALRAIKLDFKNVMWYRGGVQAWRAAALPQSRSKAKIKL